MELRIPNLGEGAESGAVVSLLVKEGDRVSVNQPVLELENEKAVAPIPSTHAGIVQKIYVKVGDKVSVGQAVLSLAEDGAGVVPTPPKMPVKETKQAYVPITPTAVSAFPPPASPSIRKLAKDLGIDLAKVKGSESGGRIILADIQAYLRNLEQQAGISIPPTSIKSNTKVSIDFSKWGPVTKKPFSSLRQKIAERLTESWATIPHVTQFDEADSTLVMDLRKKYAADYEKKGARLTLTHFVLKAVTAALKKYPVFNSSLDEVSHEIVFKEYIHLGVAVDTESGLIVPVVKNVDKKTMLEISKELESLAEKTRQRKIGLEDLKGASFTISNLGSIGGTFFTPIINKPEVGILGIGRGAVKNRLPLALSYDHRVVDGADGARFIRELVMNLENFKEEDVKI